ncbi:MAG: hypothetical protein HY783_07070, partial [Chloroflexi bacterium]|nr:hypothetical protein [Chloroflexota bacterium]
MKVYRVLALLLTVTLLASLGAACGPTPVPPTATPKPAAPTATPLPPTPTPMPAPTRLTFVDTNSGANFQWFFKTIVFPAVKKDLGLDVDYVVSSGAETMQRMKAWTPGKGDAHVLFLKPK